MIFVGINLLGVKEDRRPGNDLPKGMLLGDLLIQLAVFAALISYLMMASHCILRRDEPDMERPYRTPGYPWTPGVALALSLLAMMASIFYQPQVAFMVLGVIVIYLLDLAYFWFYSWHHLWRTRPRRSSR